MLCAVHRLFEENGLYQVCCNEIFEPLIYLSMVQLANTLNLGKALHSWFKKYLWSFHVKLCEIQCCL